MQAMSLTPDFSEGEQNELRNLQAQLDSTNRLVKTLSKQLSELKEQVSGLSVVCSLISLCPKNLSVRCFVFSFLAPLHFRAEEL